MSIIQAFMLSATTMIMTIVGCIEEEKGFVYHICFLSNYLEAD